MDYLLSREKTSNMRSNPVLARSILVHCNISTDNVLPPEFISGQDFSSVTRPDVD